MSTENNKNLIPEPIPVEATIYINSQGTEASIIYPNYGITICSETNIQMSFFFNSS